MPRVWREAISANNNGFDVSIYGFGDTEIKNGIKYVGFKQPKNRVERIIWTSRKMVELASKSNASIIQLHSPEFLLFYRKLLSKNKKVIFDSHEIYKFQILEKNYLPKKLRELISSIYDKFETYVCNRIDAVIFPCTVNGINLFDRKNKNNLKIENYPLPVNTKIINNFNNRNVIYAGSIDYGRGIKNMIEAAANEDFNLFLCGNFSSDSVKDYVFRKMNEYRNIKYFGVLDRNDLYNIYSKCSIGLCILLPVGQYPIIDNLPTKIYEYMQCGLPTIFSNFNYAKKINAKYKFGVAVDPNNIEEIKKAIIQLMNNKNSSKVCDTLKNIQVNNFNWDKEYNKLDNLYKTI